MEHCPTCSPATPEDSRNRQWRQKRSLLMPPRTLHLGDRDAVLDLPLLPRQQRARRALPPAIPPQLCRCGREADRAGRPGTRRRCSPGCANLLRRTRRVTARSLGSAATAGASRSPTCRGRRYLILRLSGDRRGTIRGERGGGAPSASGLALGKSSWDHATEFVDADSRGTL